MFSKIEVSPGGCPVPASLLSRKESSWEGQSVQNVVRVKHYILEKTNFNCLKFDSLQPLEQP